MNLSYKFNQLIKNNKKNYDLFIKIIFFLKKLQNKTFYSNNFKIFSLRFYFFANIAFYFECHRKRKFCLVFLGPL